MLDGEGTSPTSSEKKIDKSQQGENLTSTVDEILTGRSDKSGSKNSNMKILTSEEKQEKILKKRVKWEWTHDNDSSISPKKDKSQSVSENEEVSDSSSPKRSSRRRSKDSSENVLANAIARKEKSYNEAAPPQRLSRRIKPTAKVLANEKLRIGLENQNNARLGIRRSQRSAARPAAVKQSVGSKGTKSSTTKNKSVGDQEDSEKLRHLCELGLKAKDTEAVEEKDAEAENINGTSDGAGTSGVGEVGGFPLEVVYIFEFPEGPSLEVPLQPVEKKILRTPCPVPAPKEGAVDVSVDLKSTNGTSDGAGSSAVGEAGDVPLDVVYIFEYPEGPSLELPLRPPKKRRLRSPSPVPAAMEAAVEVDLPSVNGTSDATGTSTVGEVGGVPNDTSDAAGTSAGGEVGDVPNGTSDAAGTTAVGEVGDVPNGTSDGAGTSAEGEVGGVPCAQTPASLDPHHGTGTVPEKEIYTEVPACTTPKKSKNRRPLQSDEIENTINCGSDMDSDNDEDEEVAVSMGIPRTTYLYMETPTDPQPPSSSTEGSAAWMSDPLYDFKWLPYPKPPVPPQSRREKFKVNNVGPTISDTTPLQIFKRIWDADIMGTVVTETNRYAEQLATNMMKNNSLSPTSRICGWKETTVDEMYTFFGMILAMGVVIKSNMTEYFNKSNDIFSTPGFSANMSLRRFQLLCTCLHFHDNSQLSQNTNPVEARIFKISPLIKHLNFKFQTMYVMGQNISLDESLLQWRGWLQISQLIPNKAATVGIKTYEVCESQTGYLWRFIVHSRGPGTRPQAQQDPLSAFTPSLVLELLEGLQHKGYTVWMDNFYNSPILARKLKSLGFDCVGTLRTNRQFVPAAIHALQKCHMKPGQIAGLTSGDVDLMVWRDQNRVATISTYHGNTVTTDSEGVTKPALIRDYNVMMGGVDKKDQLLSSYPIERKRCRVWYKKVFRRLLNVSVLNSYIIHKKLTKNSMDHREFRHDLIKSLLQKENLRDIPIVRDIFDLRHHYLAENPFGSVSAKGRLRRSCKVCRKLATFYCVGCKKSACLGCFRQLHLEL